MEQDVRPDTSKVPHAAWTGYLEGAGVPHELRRARRGYGGRDSEDSEVQGAVSGIQSEVAWTVTP